MADIRVKIDPPRRIHIDIGIKLLYINGL